MGSICPVCHSIAKAKCGTCGFEMPSYYFLSEDDANKWYKETVTPYRKTWENRKKMKKHCKNCGNELQEEWNACPFCGRQINEQANEAGPGGAPLARVPSRKPLAKALVILVILNIVLTFLFFNVIKKPDRTTTPPSVSQPVPQQVPQQILGGLEYEIVNGRSVTITKYNGDAVSLDIPERIQGLPVTVIGNSAFATTNKLVRITIPSSVISIGDNAFSGCDRLTSIAIPSLVTSIGDRAFSGCKSLRSVTIPSSVISIGNSAFQDCSRLTTITIPSSVLYVGDYAFYGCSALTSVSISRGTKFVTSSFPYSLITKINYRD